MMGRVGIRPLADRVLVQRTAPKERKVGKIVLPESHGITRHNQGTVLAVGPGIRGRDGTLIPSNLRIGDRVLLSEFGGNELKLNGEEFTLFREEDILGVFLEEKDNTTPPK